MPSRRATEARTSQSALRSRHPRAAVPPQNSRRHKMRRLKTLAAYHSIGIAIDPLELDPASVAPLTSMRASRTSYCMFLKSFQPQIFMTFAGSTPSLSIWVAKQALSGWTALASERIRWSLLPRRTVCHLVFRSSIPARSYQTKTTVRLIQNLKARRNSTRGTLIYHRRPRLRNDPGRPLFLPQPRPK